MSIYILYIISFLNINSASLDNHYTEETTIKWYTWEEAAELAKTEPRKVFVDLYTDWCGWCKRMDKTTFQDPEVVKVLNENFYPVKFNAESKSPITFNGKTFEFMNAGRRGVHQLAYALLDGRLGYPSFVLLDESFARIMISPGYKKSPQLLTELAFAKDEQYKEMTWEDYEKQVSSNTGGAGK